MEGMNRMGTMIHDAGRHLKPESGLGLVGVVSNK